VRGVTGQKAKGCEVVAPDRSSGAIENQETTMRKLIVMIVSAGAVAVAAVAGTTQAGSAHVAGQDSGVRLEWGTGAAPRYVESLTEAAAGSLQGYGKGPLFRLSWGTGGPPELVPLESD
jgi:hypothetical protein